MLIHVGSEKVGRRPSLRADLLLSYKLWLLAHQVYISAPSKKEENFLLSEDNSSEYMFLHACNISVVPALSFKLLKNV